MNQVQENILENYRNPYHMSVPDSFTHTAKVANLSCGDTITVYLTIADNVVKKAHFSGEGCSIAIASASMIIQEIEGKNIENINNLKIESVEENLGMQLTPNRKRCGMLAVEALQDAIKS